VPALGDNALLKLAPLLERLREQPPVDRTPEAAEFVSGVSGEDVGADPGGLAGAVARLRDRAPQVVAYLLEPMLRVTLVPTQVGASDKANVIPSTAETLVDCRVPPGVGKDEVRRQVEAILGGPDGYSLEFLDHVVGNRSPPSSPLRDVIERWVARNDPGATVVPIVMAGFSDSHWFRKAFDAATVYGFCPQRELSLLEAAPLIHGADERAAVADIEFAEGFYRDVIREVLE
jgi:acetylornithine deacetylase/succinyl-diaminopimelate desuccinylase-like protein